MSSSNFVTGITRMGHQMIFQIRKAGPDIAMIGGIAGVIFASVKACQATLKVEPVIDKAKERIDEIHEAKEFAESENADSDSYYPNSAYQKDLIKVYAVTGLDLAKLYGTSVTIGTISLTMILLSHQAMKNRNAALAAAYATVSESFRTYRDRLIDRFGEQVDTELRYNIQQKKVDVIEKDDDGNTKIVAKEVDTVDPNSDGYSEYSAIFDQVSRSYEENFEYNTMFLRAQEQWANDLVRGRGHLFLNEVYDMLDLPRTEAGQIVGWVYDKDHPKEHSVEFRVHEIYKRSTIDPERYEKVLMIDPNVEGNILKELF